MGGAFAGRLGSYAIGLGAVVIAAAVKLALDSFIDTGSPFLLFLGAVMTAAWYGGFRPGMATALLAALASLFMPRRISLTPGHPGDAVNLALFLIEGSLISLLAGRLRAARGQAALGAEPALGLAERRKSERRAQDLREAQEARSAAEAANRVKDEFLATLSHELRTPLTAIVGWAHLLERGQLAPAETARAIDTIIQSATAQNQIIDELLDVSRIITGKLHLELRPVDIATAVKAAIGTVTPAANAKGIRLQLIQDPAGSTVMGDPERLQQVFWNLFSNAIKFTPKNGRVRVSVESVGSNVEVVVADTGLGIDAEFLPRVFDRFTQHDSSSTRRARGLGLGLSIARELVELHGGSIQAESPGVGHGSTFRARFPRSPITATPVDPRVYAPADKIVGLEDGLDLTGIRVLVVEDDDDARGMLETVLEARGATVKSVSSAREALDTLGRDRVDVLLSDIEMPGTDGYQLIQELRRRPSEQGGSVPAAALTAYARTEDRLRTLRAGFQLHLAKPVQPSELVTVVASLAARRQ
jgi:signal transduction histidine kinase